MDRRRPRLKAVIDTNVIAYLLLGTEQYAGEAASFFKVVAEAQAPAVWEAEIANVLWMSTRRKLLTIEEAAIRLNLAGNLGIHSVPSRDLWQGALIRACHSGIAAYDTLFVELAARERLPLATFDAALLKAFPAIAARPSELMS